MSEKRFRVIDTGVREGRQNIAFDSALIELHKAGAIPDTIRFLTFTPTALIGRHQVLGRELRLDYCREHGIGTARRLTGGGAIYMDEGQFGFELVFGRKTLAIGSLGDLSGALCTAIAAGLSNLGVEARYRPRNDIEVRGRKLGGTGGFFDGDSLFFQGTVLVRMDAFRMISCLNVPPAKLERHAIESAASRVVTLSELLPGTLPSVADIKENLLVGLAKGLGIDPEWGQITPEEEALAVRRHDEEIGRDSFVNGIDPGHDGDVRSASRATPGGLIRSELRLAAAGIPRIQSVLITGDFFVTPPRVILDLEARLRECPLAAIENTVRAFFAETRTSMLSVAPEDFSAVIVEAAMGT
ncbi:MAG: biotin/lipoate A/B protein ligase family protein [Hyphomicrobiaceae bacterium]